MSKVKIQGNASGTGVLTVTAPNTSTDRTITLPDSTGTLATTADSVGGATGVDFNDNVAVRLGTGNDLKLIHDGTHSKILNYTGDLHLASDNKIAILGGSDTAETCAEFNDNGAVNLYHDHSKKFETTATGVDVTGYLNAQEVNTHWHFTGSTQDINTNAVVAFTHEITKGSAISASAGRFTVSVAGTYLLMVMFNNASDFDDLTNVWMRKNTTRIGGSLYYEGTTAGQDYSSQGANCIVQLAANDIVDVYGQGYWSGNTNTEAGTTFQGIRIGE